MASREPRGHQGSDVISFLSDHVLQLPVWLQLPSAFSFLSFPLSTPSPRSPAACDLSSYPLQKPYFKRDPVVCGFLPMRESSVPDAFLCLRNSSRDMVSFLLFACGLWIRI